MRKCIQCESYFKPASKLNVLRSEKCARARRALQTKGHKFDAEQTCATCEKPIMPDARRATCSAECAREKADPTSPATLRAMPQRRGGKGMRSRGHFNPIT